MSEISRAIKAKQTRISELQSDIDALQRVARILGGKLPTTSKRKRRKMSAAARKAVAKRMKAYWAKKRKAAK